jgi:hypothetical protein
LHKSSKLVKVLRFATSVREVLGLNSYLDTYYTVCCLRSFFLHFPTEDNKARQNTPRTVPAKSSHFHIMLPLSHVIVNTVITNTLLLLVGRIWVRKCVYIDVFLYPLSDKSLYPSSRVFCKTFCNPVEIKKGKM